MDWNNDGKVDWKDYAILDSATSSADKENSTYESNDSSGCLILLLVVLGVFYLISLLVDIFS